MVVIVVHSCDGDGLIALKSPAHITDVSVLRHTERYATPPSNQKNIATSLHLPPVDASSHLFQTQEPSDGAAFLAHLRTHPLPPAHSS
ncbi:hypothetical protein BC938DRAFT_480038 [Jimgerdemannia flammicorona]|uniref:Uncharacterized protein n=1 Tax=Jimgerdemannia flammicorona TaxID=994334 RepID=A0A433QJJ0_9FUNG|nr:hypothetical protein BC938DRAFT_480038 [Jimgerdemannia flammicorona]